MKFSLPRLGPIFLLLAAAWRISPAVPAMEEKKPEKTGKPPAITPEQERFFEAKIRPVLVEACLKCHGDKKQSGGLRLDSRSALLAGGDTGPAIVPGDAGKSLLIKAISHAGELKMPPSKKLPREKIDDLTRWIAQGAPWPGTDRETGPVRKVGLQVTDRDRQHWAFRPVQRPAVPAVKTPSWVRNPIDAFILSRLEAKGLKPASPASRQELVRRVYYDLTGLPPTPAEVQDFLGDTRPDAWERLIDRLLASPRYGEKWARHWLDLVRYADTNSYERDNPKPNSWRFRDFVIRSFNADKPYDRFLIEQLAGDELPSPDADCLIATGYYRLGIWDDEPTDPVLAKYDGLDDIVATTGHVFLGLTLDCARCHDHKIDPIPQKDYYSFLAFFHNINHYRNGGPTDERPLFFTEQERAEHDRQTRELRQKQDQIQAALTSIEQEFTTRLRKERRGKADTTILEGDVRLLIRLHGERLLGVQEVERYNRLRSDLEAQKRRGVPVQRALCVTEAGRQAPDTCILIRGNPHARGDKVAPAFPQVLSTTPPVIPEPPADARSTGRRLVLAKWIASPDHPLTARVMVNRIWHWHFGRGLVRSVSNFGFQGDKPTHPELLDWLASEFVRQGWSMKAMHRLILTSSAYQMSSRGDAQSLAADPTSDSLWRFDMRRLTAEEIRDSILAVTGSLRFRMYGPGIYPEIPREVLQGQSMPGKGWGKSPVEEQHRRSVYIHIKRSLLVPILESHDAPETDRSAPIRFATTQPTQALGLLNGDFMNSQAVALAQRIRREAGPELKNQVRLALNLVTQRTPGEDEIRRCLRLIAELKEKDGLKDELALKCFCLLALNLNEFVYLD